MTSVHTDTSEYEFSHGKKPRGKGNWAFEVGRRGAWTTVFAPRGMAYSAAAKWAQKEAVALGCSTVCVAP